MVIAKLIMNTEKSILFVPAWWPCGFFNDQENITMEEYRPYVLFGLCKEISLKNYIKSGFKSLHYSEAIKDNVATITYSWIKYRHTSVLDRQRNRLCEKIGQSILRLTNGSLPTLVHIQSISETAIFVVDWARENQIPVILTEHLIYIRRSFDYLTKLKESLYNRANQVLCVSNYLYRNLLTSGFKLPNAQVIGNMIDDKSVPTDFSKIKKNGRVIFVAVHLYDKDIDVLIGVAKRLKNKKICIDVYGLTGDEFILGEKSLRSKIIEANVEDVIILHGKRTHDILLQTYSSYSLLLSTSRSETFGLSVAEAIAYGTKVVCTDSGGIRDFVNESNGFVTNIGDINTLSECIVNNLQIPYNLQNESKCVLDKYKAVKYKALLFENYHKLL